MKKNKLFFTLILSSLLSSCGNNAISSEVIDSSNLNSSIESESISLSESKEITYKQPENYYIFSELFTSYYDHFFNCERDASYLIDRELELTIASYDFYLKDGVEAKVISYDSDKFSLKPIESDNKIVGYSFTFNSKGDHQKVSFASNGYAYEYDFTIYEIETSKIAIAFDFYLGGVPGIYAYADFKTGNGYEFSRGPSKLYNMNKYYSNIIPGEVYEVTHYGLIYFNDSYPGIMEFAPELLNIELYSKAKVLEATLLGGQLVIEGYTNLENIFSYVYDENGNFINFDELNDKTKLYVLKIDDENDLTVCGIYTYNPYENN